MLTCEPSILWEVALGSELDPMPTSPSPGPEDFGKLVQLSKTLVFLWDKECVLKDSEDFNKIIALDQHGTGLHSCKPTAPSLWD